MPGLITCPKCHYEFQPTDAFRDEVQKELNAKAKDWQAKKEEEFNAKERQMQKLLQAKDAEIELRLKEEKKQLEADLQLRLRKSISSDYENQLQLLKQSELEKEEKLKEARRKELEFLQKEQAFKTKEEEMEITAQKRINEERVKMVAEIRRIEEQKVQQLQNEFSLKMAEKDKQLEDQKKLAEEMRRKAEQGSMQLQGEVQELALENILHQTFPFDKIVPVGKGVRGADCIQTVCNPFGNECGKIIYESKRTATFSPDWIEKLKHDMRSTGADIAVIVTQVLPKDMQRFGEKDGVYICTFAEVTSLAMVLRTSIQKVFAITKSQDGKGDKMHMLYDYLTGNEFNEQWKAIREGFLNMRMSIHKERDAMEKLWKSREKQLERVLLSAAQIRGSVEGIAGSEVNLNLLEDGNKQESED